jgi:antitoxin (DNA-binding transcriptional repressor) of toxin-antitoxin stability system
MTVVTLKEAEKQLPLLMKAALSGEEVLITMMDATVQLAPVAPQKRRPRFGSARGLIEIADDFDEPLDDFAEYIP